VSLSFTIGDKARRLDALLSLRLPDIRKLELIIYLSARQRRRWLILAAILAQLLTATDSAHRVGQPVPRQWPCPGRGGQRSYRKGRPTAPHETSPSIRKLRHDSEKAGPRMMQSNESRLGYLQIGNNIGDVNPTRLQFESVQRES
jgi:hypothetical protein